MGMVSRSFRHSLPSSTGVLPVFTTCFGPRTADAGLAGTIPAIVQQPALPNLTDASHLVPALLADAGEPAAWRYIEFFTAPDQAITLASIDRLVHHSTILEMNVDSSSVQKITNLCADLLLFVPMFACRISIQNFLLWQTLA